MDEVARLERALAETERMWREGKDKLKALQTTVRTFLHDLDAHEERVKPSQIKMNHAMWMQVQAFRNLVGEST